MSVMRGVQVRRCKNPPQGENLDKDQRQNKQYNYEQARSTRHAGRPADSILTTSSFAFCIILLSRNSILWCHCEVHEVEEREATDGQETGTILEVVNLA
jgi:hypothetical protein